VVGLTIETRPDLITPENAREMRELGCTKIQMGIQSLDQRILATNHRHVSVEQIEQAFSALRLAGFKIQVHFMANLLGSTPEADAADYLRLVSDERFLPDEVKLYPCCLVESSRLGTYFESGAWQPYSEEDLVDLLVTDTLATPAYTRISRMIRDISSTDIVAGNKKTNLRQMVEARITAAGADVREIRMREVATSDVALSDLRLDCVSYRTTVSDERFLQWVTPEGRIAGFLRLSLPATGRQAMIREVHVYGRVAGLGASEHGGAQHAGLGKALVEEACRLASEAGFEAINVISAVGTRNYYRGLGFFDAGLYQRRDLA
jgi:elongator complex protein 3